MHDEDERFDSLLAAVAHIPVPQWAPPAELDEYRLRQPLGRGGMGSVWLAHDQLLDRLVAIKFIAHDEPDRATRERFAIEARAAARLSHANVVTVFRFGEVAGRPYLVSEYIRGEPLDKLAKPVSWQRSLELGIALARGLAAAHRHGIVHRDIKPANAILAADGQAKLVDFGLARLGAVSDEPRHRPSAPAVTGRESTLTAPGTLAGTPRYLAPEVRAGQVADRRSDVYQLGCILYELVTGRAPLLDTPPAEATPSLARAVSDGVARFAAVVDRCLAVDPQRRFASGDELREALERLAAPAFGAELPDGNPYRGLMAFDAEHRALFFGRGAEIRAVLERLRAEPFVVVAGDSGVGKSSLCRAGVVPHVSEGALGDGLAWSCVTFTPGRHPVLALVSELARPLGVDEQDLLRAVDDAPGELARALRRGLGNARGLLVFVDQLEELATLADRSEAARAGELLGQLAAGVPGVRLLASVRGDFLARVAELPGLGAELSRAVYLLRSLTQDGAREAIVGPARVKGGQFESDALVDQLVASVANEHAIELPLLAFTLAQLWDARDPASQTISAQSLEAIGGVRGALALHADGVLDAMPAPQKAAVRSLLLRLVTPERTRARRTAGELGPDHASVLDALVRARLVVARDDSFELAHERLIDGWPMLAQWLAEANETQIARARLATSATDWERLGHVKQALWSERHLAQIAAVMPGEMTASERAFVAASRRALRRRRIARLAIAVAVPTIAMGLYVGSRVIEKRALDRQIAQKVAEAGASLATAHEQDAAGAQLRTRVFAHFDAGDRSAGEAAWTSTRQHEQSAEDAYLAATRTLESAFMLDTGRADVHHRLAQLLADRIQLLDRQGRLAEAGDLETQLPLYDDGTIAARLQAHLHAAIAPHAAVTLETAHGETALPASLRPGVYTLVARATGRVSIRMPILLEPGAHVDLAFELPMASAVPRDDVFVPPGTFLYGSRDVEAVRKFFDAEPMHAVSSGAFLIARTETTYAQWIAFLDDLPAEERAQRTPRIESSATVQEARQTMALSKAPDGVWQLDIAPVSVAYHARAGEPITYEDRTRHASQDWLEMPVSGITPEDAEAYAKWLARTGKVPHARLCSESEWEYAARGVDGRAYPAGHDLAADDANIDVTYGQKDGAFGPDEVGSHPASTSPFGLADTSGSLWEITRARDGGFVTRGGTFYNDATTAHLANRQVIDKTYRQVLVGVRICADAP